jgi:hypothetical protein
LCCLISYSAGPRNCPKFPGMGKGNAATKTTTTVAANLPPPPVADSTGTTSVLMISGQRHRIQVEVGLDPFLIPTAWGRPLLLLPKGRGKEQRVSILN